VIYYRFNADSAFWVNGLLAWAGLVIPGSDGFCGSCGWIVVGLTGLSCLNLPTLPGWAAEGDHYNSGSRQRDSFLDILVYKLI